MRGSRFLTFLILNRLRPIPFKVIIPPEEIDKELLAKLLEEAEGILAWSVAGAIQWYLKGLGDPPEVQEESQKWRKDMDQIGRFIEERCIQGPVVDNAKARQLYTDGEGGTFGTRNIVVMNDLGDQVGSRVRPQRTCLEIEGAV